MSASARPSRSGSARPSPGSARPSVGVGAAVAVGIGAAVAVGVGVGAAVAVGVGAAVAVRVGAAVAVGVGAAVGAAVAVAVAVVEVAVGSGSGSGAANVTTAESIWRVAPTFAAVARTTARRYALPTSAGTGMVVISSHPLPAPGMPVLLSSTAPSSSSTSRLAETPLMPASSACTQMLIVCGPSSSMGAHQYCESIEMLPASLAVRCAAAEPACTGSVSSMVKVALVAHGDHPRWPSSNPPFGSRFSDWADVGGAAAASAAITSRMPTRAVSRYVRTSAQHRVGVTSHSGSNRPGGGQRGVYGCDGNGGRTGIIATITP